MHTVSCLFDVDLSVLQDFSDVTPEMMEAPKQFTANLQLPMDWTLKPSLMGFEISPGPRGPIGSLRVKGRIFPFVEEKCGEMTQWVTENTQLLRGREDVRTKLEPTGNVIANCMSENGLLFGKKVSHVWDAYGRLPPYHVYHVEFTYKISSSAANRPEVVQELKMLDREIRKVEFASVTG